MTDYYPVCQGLKILALSPHFVRGPPKARTPDLRDFSTQCYSFFALRAHPVNPSLPIPHYTAPAIFNMFQPPALRRMTGNDPNNLPTVIVPRSHVPRIVSV